MYNKCIMGLFERIFKRKIEQRRLPSKTTFNKVGFDKTEPYITIQAIEELIYKQDVFERFIDFGNNQDFFGCLKQDFIARSVKEYVDFMIDKGVKFDKKARNRIEMIEAVLPKEERNLVLRYLTSFDIDKARLYETALEIVSSSDMFHTFLEHQNTREPFRGIPTRILSKYISGELYNFEKNILINGDNEDISKNIKFLFDKDEKISNRFSCRINSDIRLNPDFKSYINQAIGLTTDDVEYAAKLYDALNKRVKFNPSYFALDRNLDNKFVHDIYYKEAEKINKNDNSVVCKQWAELYGYMLSEKGWEVYICGAEGKHKSVIAFKGTIILEADATQPIASHEGYPGLTDLVRSRLGILPARFKVYNYNGDFSNFIPKSDLSEMIRDVQNRTQNNKTLELIVNLIDDDRKLTQRIMKLNDTDSEVGNILKAIGYINDQLKKSELDNMESGGYINFLYNIIPELHKSKRVNLRFLYKEIYSNNCTEIPIFVVNKAKDQDKPNNEDFLYFQYLQEPNKIQPISREKLLELAVSGKYVSRVNKKFNMPGMPELDSKGFIKNGENKRYGEEISGKDENGDAGGTRGAV